MSANYFTIEEANALIPTLQPLLEALLICRTNIVDSREEIIDLVESGQSDIGGRAASALVQDFIKIERLSSKIRAHGCELKDLNKGLIDFLSVQDGREVYLCWQIGEPAVAYYHELHTGFAGRQKLNQD